MLSLHPTISFTELISYLLLRHQPQEITDVLKQLFPEQNTVLTDSGRSAFAVVVETLRLQNTSMILPAYVCDAFLPLLQTYNIKPIFLDVETDSFQPPLNAYTDALLKNADSILLVATYGRQIDNAILQHLKEQGKIIIEDYSMRSPLLKEPLIGDARIYSLPKTLPVPDGGLAILQKTPSIGTPQTTPTLSISYLKNIIKLLPGMAILIAGIRDGLKSQQTSASWYSLKNAKPLTKKIFINYINQSNLRQFSTTYPYCLPIKTNHPTKDIKKLRRHFIQAERIWHQPIILNPDTQKTFSIKAAEFPVTIHLAKQIICLPMWHIHNEQDYKNYLNRLEKILPNFSRE